MKAIRHSLLGILGLCLAGFSPAAAQDSPAPDDYLTISGIVRDIETQQELAYATISVPDNSRNRSVPTRKSKSPTSATTA